MFSTYAWIDSFAPGTHDETILIDVQFLTHGLDRLVVRLVLDDLHGRLQVVQRDLTLRVALDRVQRRSNLFVVRLELVVDRLDHLSDPLVKRDLGGLLVHRLELGFLRALWESAIEQS